MAAGNWVSELVRAAGGEALFAGVGQHLPWLEWDDLLAADGHHYINGAERP